MLNSPGKPQLIIDNQLVQLRHAVDLVEMEWESLLPEIPEKLSLVPDGGGGNVDSGQPDDSLLQKRISAMLEPVIIPNSVNKALSVIDTLTKLLLSEMKASRIMGTPEVHMFRNWYLQFKNTASNLLFLYAQQSQGILNKKRCETSTKNLFGFTLTCKFCLGR